ncbi:hypothetical protein F5B18DRAFT_518707 [Nemania serpens]|nr:hypothetical protein F5B18DRAFT_518707 [Nemania serpens]
MADYINNNNDSTNDGNNDGDNDGNNNGSNDDNNPEGTIPFKRDESQWPRSFALTTPPSDSAPRQWWRHDYYRNSQGQSVEVLYSKTKSQSEVIAQQFANEPVLGFDMEWPWDGDRRLRLQDRIALIQLASERKVALFHISQHQGTTVDDFMAPTLKAILESPKIIKAGVAVVNADFKRLRGHFNLEPKGAFELSHLHNLITYGATTPRSVTTKLRSLSTQVEKHLGLPLWKGSARTSDWSQPLNYTQTQYAATDAYAGFMLFHCMNAKRLAMDPAPPLPVFAETYLASGARRSTTIQLESITEDGEVRIIGVEDFFRIKNAEKYKSITEENVDGEGGDTHIDANIPNGEGRPVASGAPRDKTKEPRIRKPRRDAKTANANILESMDDSCWVLYNRLVYDRMQVASSQGIAAFIIAHNTLLRGLAFHRPSNEQELLLVPGVGKVKAAQYGTSWLEIIAEFKAEQKEQGGDHNNNNNIDQDVGDQEEGGDVHLEVQDRGSKRRRIVRVDRSKEILIPPGETPAVLSTGLSFNFGEASLVDEPSPPPQPEKQADSKPHSNFNSDFDLDVDLDFDFDADDYDSIFGPPMEMPSPSTLKRKRDIVAPADPKPQRDRSAGTAQMPILIPEPQPPVKLELATALIPATEPRLQEPAIPASISVPKLSPLSRPVSTALRPKLSPLSRSVSTASRPHAQAPLENPGWGKVILRNKLEAYVKSVAWAMYPKPIEPLVSEATIQHLITTVPRTMDEFRRAPGIQRLVKACEVVKMDVWRTFEKWTRNQGVVPSVGSSR